MGSSKTIGPKRKKKILSLINLGFTDSQISKSMGIRKTSIHNIREEKHDNSINQGSTQKMDQSEKTSESKHSSEISDEEISGDSRDINSDQSQGPGGPLKFVGGKKFMANKTNTDEDINTCGACGGEIKGTPRFCPHCGVELQGE